jgi:hypothetical protein
VRVQVLQVLTEMFRKSSLATSFTNYVELLVLRILQCHKDTVKDVSKNYKLKNLIKVFSWIQLSVLTRFVCNLSLEGSLIKGKSHIFVPIFHKNES